MAEHYKPLNEGKALTERLDVELALEAAQLGVWELDPVTNLINWDDRCRQLCGLSVDNHISYEQAIQYIHPDDLEWVDKAVKRAMNPQSGGHFDATYRTIGSEDGPLRWVRFMGRSYVNEAGKVYRFAGVAQGVTKDVETRHQLAASEARFRGLIEEAPVASYPIATKKLQESEHYFQKLTDTVPAILWLTEADGYCTYLNRQWYSYTGQTEAEAQGFGWLSATHPADKEETERLFVEANDKHTAFHALYRLRGQDGQYRWVIDKASPRFDINGVYEGMIGTVVDVHEQTQDRQNLIESESRFRNLIEDAPVATGLYVGPNMIVELANDVLIGYWGKDRSVIGKPLAEALPELQGQPFLRLLDKVFTTGRTHQEKAARADLDVDGILGTYYFDYTYKPVRDAEGNIYGVINMAIDVTEAVKARQQVTEAEASLRGAIELAELATWSMDVEKGTFTYSDRFMEWLGFTEATKRIDDAYNPLPNEYRQSVAEALAAVTAPGSSGLYENEHPIINRLTGQMRIIHAQAQLFYNTDGKPTVLSGTAQDVTEQRKTQFMLEQRVQQRTQELDERNIDLQRSNKNLEQFAYVASHDLQEPLRKIQSFGDILQSQYADKLGDGVDFLQRMQSAANRMSVLIKDLLTYSRISTQQEATAFVPLTSVVQSVLTDLELITSETGAVIAVDTLPTVRGDESQLGQLFQNLLSNALKFRRPDLPPAIQINTRQVAFADLLPSAKPAKVVATYHRIDVADNGIGFDQKYTDRIFQVFQRLHGKNEFVGTGIGLAICEKVAANHGGAITAISQPGQGTTFILYLPVLD